MSRRVKASGPRNAELAIVGMAPAVEETIRGVPFVGPSGGIVNSALERLGVPRSEVFVTNVCEYALPVDQPSLFQLPANELTLEKDRLRRELLDVKPNCLFVLGDETAQIVCGIEGIMKWRGSILDSILVPGQKCVVSMHPAAILRSALWRWAAIFRHIDLKRAVEQSAFPEIIRPRRDKIIASTPRMIEEYVGRRKDEEWCSFDYETFGDLRIACIGVGYSAHEAMCVPFVNQGGQPYWSEHDEIRVWQAIAGLLQDTRIKKIGQNLSFEWLISWAHNILPSNIGIDTMLLHHCLYPDFGGTEDPLGTRKRKPDQIGHSLAFINSQYTTSAYYKEDRKLWKSRGLAMQRLWDYNCMDVMVTYEAAMKMRDEAMARGLWDIYERFYNKPFPYTVAVEWRGIEIDIEKRRLARAEARCDDESCGKCKWCVAQHELGRLVGHPLNIWSTPQMRKLLYKEMGFPERKERKKGHVTANRETLEYFAAQRPDRRLDLILEMRKLSDYISDVLDTGLDEDNHTHTHYKLGGTDGMRWSSTKSILGGGTNWQNVPRDGVARDLYLP